MPIQKSLKHRYHICLHHYPRQCIWGTHYPLRERLAPHTSFKLCLFHLQPMLSSICPVPSSIWALLSGIWCLFFCIFLHVGDRNIHQRDFFKPFTPSDFTEVAPQFGHMGNRDPQMKQLKSSPFIPCGRDHYFWTYCALLEFDSGLKLTAISVPNSNIMWISTLVQLSCTSKLHLNKQTPICCSHHQLLPGIYFNPRPTH